MKSVSELPRRPRRRDPGNVEIRTTCPRDCYDACGVIVTRNETGIVRVGGDPDHAVARGTLCGKCTLAYNGAWIDRNARLTAPLKRVGRKGAGEFEPVGWDEALDLISSRLQPILAEGRGDRVIHTHYTGTCSLLAYSFPMRFFNKVGATEIDPDSVCNKAGHTALEMVFGSSLDGFDPRTAPDADCILVWGANPSSSAPHAHRHWLREAAGKVVVVDPIRHPTAEEAALHLQPYPGSDAALAFAMLHVLEREGMVDEEFLENHVLGHREVRARFARCTPRWGEEKTGVPAGLIEEAARRYGSGPSLLWLGQGVQRQATGGNVTRACSLMPVFTGNVGKRGTGLLYMNGDGNRGIDEDYLTAPHLNPSRGPKLSHMDFAARLEDAAESRVLFSWNSNPAASAPNQSRLRRALEREDLFTVAVDLFPTDTCDYADVVLPAASFLEFDDLLLSYFNYTVSAQAKASKPMGESLSNQEIFRRLSGRMGFREPELFQTDEEMLADLMRQTGLCDADGGPMSFEQLARVGTVSFSPEPIVPFEDRVFPTPSGKIEVAGDKFGQAGLPRAPQPWADERPASGKLRLLSPASEWLMNSSYDNVAKVRGRTGAGDVFLHPAEGKARGLNEGSSVLLRSDAGELLLRLAFSRRVLPGVALVHKGRWPKLDPAGANVNVLNPGRKSDLAESSSVHSVEVELTPLESLGAETAESAIGGAAT